MDRIDTADPEEAAEMLGRTFPGTRIEAEPADRPFRLRYSRDDLGPLTRTVLSVQGALRATGTYPDHIAVGRRHRGRVTIDYGGERLDTSLPYLRAPGASVAVFDDSTVELLIVDRTHVDRFAQRHLGRAGLPVREPRPGRSSPSSPRGVRLWNATADAVSSAFESGSTLTAGLAGELAIAALCTAFPLAEERSRPGGLDAPPRVVRRVTEYIDAHLADPLTVVSIAEATHVSVRTLQAGFRRHLDTTPLVYLRRARLQAAHDELAAAAPDETSVAESAHRWGFAHLSRFAAAYRREFGEYPAQTLRR